MVSGQKKVEAGQPSSSEGSPEETSWCLPAASKTALQDALKWAHTHFAATAAAPPSKAASNRLAAKAAEAESESLSGRQLLDVIRKSWMRLGAGAEEAAHMAAAILTAAAAPEEELSDEAEHEQGKLQIPPMSWADFEHHMSQAFTEVTRQQLICSSLSQAKQLLQEGTRISPSQHRQALACLRDCIAADAQGDAVESLQGRLLLAKQLHALARSESDLSEASDLLGHVMQLAEAQLAQLDDEHDSDDDDEDEDEEEEEEEEDRREALTALITAARTGLGLMLGQAGQDTAAAAVMGAAGYLYRLAPPVLSYQLPTGTETAVNPLPADPSPYVQVREGALPAELLHRMQAALGPSSPFWSEHDYKPDGSTPYFSYVHPLPEQTQEEAGGVGTLGGQEGGASSSQHCLLDQVIDVMRRHATALFPEASQAKFAEWWAHCRPHSHGHQLHFDSDNEGKGQVRNPIVSMVVYLTEGVGGPTLVTPQPFGQAKVAEHGWLVQPRLNRLTVFKGNVLHGVIPGRGSRQAGQGQQGGQVEQQEDGRNTMPFRVTFMVALWPDIRVRSHPEGQPGAAQPYPYPGADVSAAIKQTAQTQLKKKAKKSRASTATWPAVFAPVPGSRAAGRGEQTSVQVIKVEEQMSFVQPIWVDVDEQANSLQGLSLKQLTAAGKLPPYDVCFQGF